MTLTRRHFLVAAAGGVAVAASSSLAGSSSASADAALPAEAAFATASKATGVPVAVLAGFSWAQTRWGDHADRPSAGGGYGPMHLIDGERAAALVSEQADKQVPGIDTLGAAAAASGLSKQQIRTDAQANIMAAAALIKQRQQALKQPTSATDPAAWYAAVADAAGLTSPDAQVDFADQVMGAAKKGVQHTVAGGTRVSLTAVRVGSTSAQRARIAGRHHEKAAAYPLDAPKGLDVEWVPAPYTQYGTGTGDYGNHDLKPNEQTPALRYVVIHDTEGSWDVSLKLVQDPTYLGWHYTVRSADGHIAEHLRPAEAMGWHAGNWYINQHSIGVEHEGYMAMGTTWYSEPMYRHSARLVSYLCHEHKIPLDRAHVIGHDMVPGTTPATIPGMHVDPGPYWDWEHYFELMGAPLDKGTEKGHRRQGFHEQVVRILPHFDTNFPPVSGCTVAGTDCATLAANFLPVHTQPDETSPLITDIGLHPKGTASTTDASDMGARATAGQDYVAVERRGEWLAIWFLGQLGWIHDPDHTPRTRVVKNARVVRPKPGVDVPVYGRCYPEASAYPSTVTVQSVVSLPYQVGAGQAYVVTDEEPVTDYYKAKTFSLDTPGDHIDVVGTTKYLQISYGPRIAFVQADQVLGRRMHD